MTESDGPSEPSAVGDGPPPSSADERAAREMLEMQEMQAAIDAERAERAAREASSASVPAHPSQRTERLGLAVLTSSLSEFRDSGGRLQAFELNGGHASVGTLCAALSRMPGVTFPDHDGSSWFRRPSRFIFRDTLYEVGIAHGNLSVAPVERGPAIPELEELFEYVRANVLKGVKSRYVTTHRIG
jgi:hypothetical protein